MKTGLFLFQSIASSALRCGCRTSSAAAAHHGGKVVRPTAALSTLLSDCHHVRVGAAAYAAAGLIGGGTSTMVLCSNDADGATSKSNSNTASNEEATTSVRKSIDDPLHILEHNPSLPFPESSLKHDTYNGVTLDVTKVPQLSDDSSSSFKEMLSNALAIWSDEGRRGIWIRIPTSHAHLIESATKLGFDFQFAEPGVCVLTKWLPKDTESRLPNGPSHQVGVGVLVLHPITGKMLVVQERTGPAAARKLWKMPTGLTDPGEDIAAAAVRELKEETGLDVEFDKIICFRQAHGGLFNRSDMFFVCLCKLAPKYEILAKQGGTIELLPQEEEILCADWMDMEDYAVQGVWKESPLYKEMNAALLKAARNGIAYSSGEEDDESHGFVSKVLPVGFRPGKNAIYVSSKL